MFRSIFDDEKRILIGWTSLSEDYLDTEQTNEAIQKDSESDVRLLQSIGRIKKRIKSSHAVILMQGSFQIGSTSKEG